MFSCVKCFQVACSLLYRFRQNSDKNRKNKQNENRKPTDHDAGIFSGESFCFYK